MYEGHCVRATLPDEKAAASSHKPPTADMKRGCDVTGMKELRRSAGDVNTHSERKRMAKPSALLLSRRERKH